LWLVVKRPCIIKPYYPTTRFLMMLWWLWILLTPKKVASIGSNFLVWQHVGVVNYNAPGFWPAVIQRFPHFPTASPILSQPKCHWVATGTLNDPSLFAGFDYWRVICPN
jgi:hypothetical protein